MRPALESCANAVAGPRTVALAGVSGYARFYLQHLLALQAAGRVRIAAAAVINREEETEAVARLQAGGCAVSDNFDDMLAAMKRRVDLCCLPVGIASHARLVRQALRAGLDVLVEKPLTATLADAVCLQQQATAARRFIAVGFQDTYNPVNHRLKMRFLAGEIGKLRRIRILGLWPREFGYYRRNAWAGKAAHNGEWVNDSPCSNAFAHFLNLALFFAARTPLGVARATAVRAERYRCQPIETFDTVRAEIETDSGVDIHFQATHSGAGYEPVSVAFDGDTGSARWTHLDGYRLHDANGRELAAERIGDEGTARDEMFARVLARCEDANQFIFDAAMASEHVRLVQAIHLAGETTLVPESATVPRRDATGLVCGVQIAGLDEHMKTAFARGVSLAEAGCRWATQPRSAPPEAFGTEAYTRGPALVSAV